MYSQHTSIFYASLKNKQIFPSITPRWPQCSSCSSYKVIAPDFASLHWLFPGAFFSHYLPLTLTSFKALFKCYPLLEIFSNHEFKMAAHAFPWSFSPAILSLRAPLRSIVGFTPLSQILTRSAPCRRQRATPVCFGEISAEGGADPQVFLDYTPSTSPKSASTQKWPNLLIQFNSANT